VGSPEEKAKSRALFKAPRSAVKTLLSLSPLQQKQVLHHLSNGHLRKAQILECVQLASDLTKVVAESLGKVVGSTEEKAASWGIWSRGEEETKRFLFKNAGRR
jgi:hypothetical protein